MRRFLILCVLILGTIGHTYAQSDTLTVKQVTTTTHTQGLGGKEVSRKDIYKALAQIVSAKVKTSYSSLNLKFKDAEVGTDTYSDLQKLVYLDILPNTSDKVYPDKTLSAYSFYTLVEKALDIKLLGDSGMDITQLKKRNTLTSDINFVVQAYKDLTKSSDASTTSSSDILEKKQMFFDVYNTLKTSHYNRDNIDEKEMLYSAMQGLAVGTKDKFTAFFPPTQNQNFQDGLSGNYEGIGAYVDMVKAGEVSIISPIVDGPAFKAGIKAGDIIIAIGDKKIMPNTALSDAVSWIKGPAGSIITLSILRDGNPLKIDVKREKIIIKEVDYKAYPASQAFYIQVKGFGDNTYSDFVKALDTLKKTDGIKKIIIDVRNNPGGYLDVVNEMLSYFVPSGENVSVIKYYDYTLENKSSGYTDIDFGKYQLVLLENGGTASASEILVGTIKDYFQKAVIIGENSYGKGSVQTIKPYSDGSSLKFTIAKWYTGKTQIGIDGVGIKPDIEVKITDENAKVGLDSQLDAALKY